MILVFRANFFLAVMPVPQKLLQLAFENKQQNTLILKEIREIKMNCNLDNLTSLDEECSNNIQTIKTMEEFTSFENKLLEESFRKMAVRY